MKRALSTALLGTMAAAGIVTATAGVASAEEIRMGSFETGLQSCIDAGETKAYLDMGYTGYTCREEWYDSDTHLFVLYYTR